jgi:hypothetical protein
MVWIRTGHSSRASRGAELRYYVPQSPAPASGFVAPSEGLFAGRNPFEARQPAEIEGPAHLPIATRANLAYSQ